MDQTFTVLADDKTLVATAGLAGILCKPQLQICKKCTYADLINRGCTGLVFATVTGLLAGYIPLKFRPALPLLFISPILYRLYTCYNLNKLTKKYTKKNSRKAAVLDHRRGYMRPEAINITESTLHRQLADDINMEDLQEIIRQDMMFLFRNKISGSITDLITDITQEENWNKHLCSKVKDVHFIDEFCNSIYHIENVLNCDDINSDTDSDKTLLDKTVQTWKVL